VLIPDVLIERYNNGLVEYGKNYAYKDTASRICVDNPSPYLDKYSEDDTLEEEDDDTGLHQKLLARTRIGESSIQVIPLFYQEHEEVLNASIVRTWSLRSISTSRKEIVEKLIKDGIPPSWQKTALLRNSYPLKLDCRGRWIEKPSVVLDDELGLIFE
jgi:hypothetical protein